MLDVGCASGYIAERLVKKGCQVSGIEIDDSAAKLSQRYCKKVITGDVEHMKILPFPDNYFDIIIYSDLLEHLKRPDLILQKFKRYLRDDGFVIASIPNIARLEFRIKLAFGRFEYEEGGILKKDHLRFFTLSSAKKLFNSAGYSVVRTDYTGFGSRVKIFPTLLAFQFIIVAQKAT